MLDVRLTQSFATAALDLAFSAPEGITALFGRSGAGKTTIVNAVAGLLKPDDGRIVLQGEVLFDARAGVCVPPHRRRVGYVFQDARLFPHLTVRRNLLFGQRFSPAPSSGVSLERIVALLDLAALLDRRPGALSGGEKQRVALGRAILSNPRMLLLDEPLAALDGARKGEILTYLERLRDEVRLPMLYVSHSVAEVARLATTLVLIDKGRVQRAGPVAEVLSDPTAAPGFGLREAGSILHARVRAHDADGLSELETDAGSLFLPRVAADPGHVVRLRILAQDVMLAIERPRGVSALNILPATVSALREGEGPGALVQLAVGASPLLARITRRSARALGLEPGVRVHAVIKAVSVARGDIGDEA